MLPRRWLIRIEIAAAALVAVVVTWILAAPGSVPSWEAAVFRGINGLGEAFIVVLWPPMQFGSLSLAAIIAVVLFVFRLRLAAVAYAVAIATGWTVAVIVKEVVARGRPLAEGLDVVLRNEQPTGFGFISGHATVAFAGATVLWAFFGPRWGSLAYLLATLAAVARVFVGAHLPLDVIGGAAAGTLIGSAAAYFEVRLLHRRIRRDESEPVAAGDESGRGRPG